MTTAYPFPVSEDEFKGKRVLVTGGTKGMGQAMVRRFTLSGAFVATTARSPLPEGQAVALFAQTDIGTAEGVQDIVSRIQQEWGGLDILVNNVGGSDAPNGGYKALSDDGVKVARKDGEGFDCATWLRKEKELPKERFKGEVGAAPNGERDRALGDHLLQAIQESVASGREGPRNRWPDTGN